MFLCIYLTSTKPLLNLYLTSTKPLPKGKVISYSFVFIISNKVNIYSHVGNKVFPAWELNVPTLGINAAQFINSVKY